VALPWVSLAVADYGVKLALAALSIAPYGFVLTLMRPRQAA
jgi:queuosine precursor transporter